MLASKMLISTLKEDPQEAKIVSHNLLLRAGMIKQLVPGVYNYLPLGVKVLTKIQNIIKENMNEASCCEMFCSAIQPKELWDESKRWDKYGKELIRFKDRHDKEFCLGPTHEEIFTDIVRSLVKSSKNLPINLYQIQTKYRDEVRPRFGLIRGREFIMKDSYSFDKDEEGLEISYQLMYDTYTKIFNELDIKHKVVLADTGNIGGNGSHQFMALSDIGESTISYCSCCNYAADIEKAECVYDVYNIDEEIKDKEIVSTPKVKTIEEVSRFLNVSFKRILKSVLYKDLENNRFVLACVRGDREVNEVKLVNELNISEAFLELASDEDIKNLGSIPGYIGPVGLNCLIICDKEVEFIRNMVVGSNIANHHTINVNFNKDFTCKTIDLRTSVENDLCPICRNIMHQERGIEVGQLFKLQTKYSQMLKCTYANEEGQNVPMVMGCYGIGVTRTMAAIVEQHYDQNGIIWPLNVAPFEAVLLPISTNDELQTQMITKLYKELKSKGVDVILDDRANKAGFKFKDWDLIGVPFMVIAGKGVVNNSFEVKERHTSTRLELTFEEVINYILEKTNKK